MGANKKISMDDVREFSKEDLVSKITSDVAQLAKSKFQHKVTGLDNPSSIRAKRRDIARLKTVLTEKNKKA